MGFYDEVKVWVNDEVDQAEKSYTEIEESLSEFIKDQLAEEVVEDGVEIEAVEIPAEQSSEQAS